jgi:hypothetical protein
MEVRDPCEPGVIETVVKQRLWRQSYTDGSVVEAYSGNGSAGDVELVVIEKPYELGVWLPRV